MVVPAGLTSAAAIRVLAELKPVLSPLPPPAPGDIIATGHDSRIDLRWPVVTDPNLEGYNIYRAESAKDPFIKLNDSVHKASVYSDFCGVNGKKYCYRVKSVAIRGGGEPPSNVGYLRAMTDEQLTSVQEATFRF
jgi:hypothetical protein